ncbi:(5-formylfuran-3-yl)methyl phosphate synthase [Allorhodopirellula solitaria]|uniref:(5-formylfuran-3-yl)methyl phosphate synthase n=1 Tax=Allorhodopirellula solitaria TaxID=2527987 RepID=A0A5C5XNW5_9BACT|nr:(5-formylfuran-3-yl)methyl phosphate synthase [Allorhodopirellula solitaria]TWT64877.1 hypothetical protein CA85_36620 [Allorhodopirellula solitaria]
MPADSTLAAPPRRWQLLVSVRNLDEAKTAAALGVDIIDFKEPRRGPLAPVDAAVWEAAAQALPDASLSAALGESDSALRLASRVPATFRFAKVGPSGLRAASDLTDLWSELPLPASVELVPVAYADADTAACVEVEQVLELVIAAGRTRMLIDTFSKDGRSLFDHLTHDHLVRLLRRANAAGVWVALAGSVRLDQVAEFAEQPVVAGCWGVRGDVCVPSVDRVPSVNPAERRAGQLDADRVHAWMQTLQTHGN